MKTTSRPFVAGQSLRARLSRWWSTHAVARPSSVVVQGTMAALCFAVLAIGMPALFHVNNYHQDAQQMRERSERLAQIQDAGEVIRNDANAPSLLQHDWLRSVEYSLERDPNSALSQYAAYERDRAALDGLESFQAVHMSRAEDVTRQAHCLAEAIYYEARSEAAVGQLAVAEVIMNRVLDHRYPNQVCDVVYQGATRTTGCQFTFTCDGAMSRSPVGKKWDKAQLIASHVMMGLNEAKTSGATHYHATYVNPVWNSGLVKTRKIGTHIFYRFPRGAEWAAARAKMDHRMAQRRSGLTTLSPATPSSGQSTKLIKPVASDAVVPVEAAAQAPGANTVLPTPEPPSANAPTAVEASLEIARVEQPS